MPKTCPISFATVTAQRQCVRSACAWWRKGGFDADDMCAVAAIAERLTDMFRYGIATDQGDD